VISEGMIVCEGLDLERALKFEEMIKEKDEEF